MDNIPTETINDHQGGYFWYDNDQKLEEQVSNFIITNWVGMLFRRAMCIVMLAYLVVKNIYSKDNLNDLKFFTMWGTYLTFLTFFFGSWTQI